MVSAHLDGHSPTARPSKCYASDFIEKTARKNNFAVPASIGFDCLSGHLLGPEAASVQPPESTVSGIAKFLLMRENLLDGLLNEPERIGVFYQSPHFCAVEPRWNFGVDL